MCIRYFHAQCLLIFLFAAIAATSQERGLMLDLGSMSKVGFTGYITPHKAHFTPFLGIRYDHYGTRQENVNFLRIPFGIDFHFGNRVRFVFGAALYHSWLINYAGIELMDHNRSLWGGHLCVGWEVRMSSKFSMGLRFRNYRDLTPSHSIGMVSNSGGNYTSNQYLKDYFIGIQLKCRLNRDAKVENTGN